MKTMKKILAMALMLMLVLSLSVPAWAENNCTITITNSANGATYTVYKILDAVATEDGTGVAYYTDNEHRVLLGKKNTPFTVGSPDSDGRIPVKLKSGNTAESIVDYLKTSDRYTLFPVAATEIGNGGELVIRGLAPGYYYITSSVGSVVTLNTTTSNVNVIDKNSDEPKIYKTVNDTKYEIGQTINYTISVQDISNSYYDPDTGTTYYLLDYYITDTLPPFMSNVTVTSIKVNNVAIATQQFDTHGKITIHWGDMNGENYTPLYSAPATIEVNYSAVLTSTTNIEGNGDTNRVTLSPHFDKPGTPPPWEDPYEATTTIYTYAAAIKKVDANDPRIVLPGAEFQILKDDTPMTFTYTPATGTHGQAGYTPGFYTVDPAGTVTTLVTDEDGMIYIVGVDLDGTYKAHETKAPDGYNLLTTDTNLNVQETGRTIYTVSGVIYYDADGNVVATEEESETQETVTCSLTDLDANALEVQNNKGIELPSTGGIGTTIFYVVGSLFLLAAAVVILNKRRANCNG